MSTVDRVILLARARLGAAAVVARAGRAAAIGAGAGAAAAAGAAPVAFGSGLGAGQRPSNTAVCSEGSVTCERPHDPAAAEACTVAAVSRN